MVRNMTTLVEQIPTYLPCPTMFFNMDDPRKKSNLLHHPFSSFKNAKLTVHIVLTNSHDGHRWLATIWTLFTFSKLTKKIPKKLLDLINSENPCVWQSILALIVLTNSHNGHRWLATLRTPFMLVNNEPKKSWGLW